MNTSIVTSGFSPLSHWGLIRARGADAVKFLQGQLTNDVAGLDRSSWRLAGFCSAKGRLQASFLVWKTADDEVLLACAASVLAATLKRLQMFVMRAQCKLSDAGAEVALFGALGSTAQELVGSIAVGATIAVDGGLALRLPGVAGVARCVLAVAPSASPAHLGASDAWRELEVRSGVPLIEAATVDQFVPQMLNYELIGGVDFQKGCYPGQEVVARSQYRGTIKRRMFLFESDAPADAGQEVFHEADPGQPAGMVVNAAPAPNGAVALVELKLAALAGGAIHLANAAGPTLRRVPLAYDVPIDPGTPA